MEVMKNDKIENVKNTKIKDSILDEVLNVEENAAYDNSYSGLQLSEETIKNILSLGNIKDNGQILGKKMVGVFDIESVKDFCRGIVEGYKKTKDKIAQEAVEEKSLNEEFEDWVPGEDD